MCLFLVSLLLGRLPRGERQKVFTVLEKASVRVLSNDCASAGFPRREENTAAGKGDARLLCFTEETFLPPVCPPTAARELPKSTPSTPLFHCFLQCSVTLTFKPQQTQPYPTGLLDAARLLPHCLLSPVHRALGATTLPVLMFQLPRSPSFPARLENFSEAFNTHLLWRTFPDSALCLFSLACPCPRPSAGQTGHSPPCAANLFSIRMKMLQRQKFYADKGPQKQPKIWKEGRQH